MRRLAALLVLLPTLALAGPDPLAHEEIVLGNGLRVFLMPDRRTPTVHVITWYRVGSGDEVAGRSGFAHLFEHLMFQGSPHAAKGVIDQLFEEAGGWTNAYTSWDQTVYIELAGSPILERALWLEADRISGLPAAIDEAKLINQRDVVLNERREILENQPYGMAEVLIGEALWPVGHPYHHPVIGYTDDLNAARLDDVKAFFATHYTPRNAVMVIAGDFDPALARVLVQKYLAWIPAPPAPKRAEVPAPPPIEKEIVLKSNDAVQVPRVYLVWRGVSSFSADEAALDVACAVLTGGKSSRLYQRLVVDARLAQNVHCGVSTATRAGDIQIVATAKPGIDPARITAAVDVELSKLAAAAPAAEEMERARNQYEARSLRALENAQDCATRLAEYVVVAGDPAYFNKDLQRYRAITGSDVQRVVGKYLQPGARVNLTIQPGPKNATP